jgi:3-deoxy-D-manno-octulosonic-acid transferase
LYTIYQLILTILFYSALPVLLAYVWITGKHREGLRQRFGFYGRLLANTRGPRIWLHAASVGEVQAAGVLIAELRQQLPDADFVLTTMTLHGRKLAEERLPADVVCRLAPLDVPGVVDLAIYTISPDVYVCIETELWPVLLRRLRKRSTPLVLANGRMSERSAVRYRKHSWLFKRVVDNFNALCMITDVDKKRYLSLGVQESAVEVTGNLKYDRDVSPAREEIILRYRHILGIEADTEVFIGGSTHTGEEDILLPVYQALSESRKLLWIIAPRHLHRLGQVEELLNQNAIGFDRFSALAAGNPRKNMVVLLDSFGELSDMYSIGTYIFCGGSLVERNGHNILEPALWGKAVLYGPSMGDFQDAVELLCGVDGGVPVASGREIFEKITFFRENPDAYLEACRRAGEVASAQQGAAHRQADIIVSLLAS